jgi:hypothetical protein
MNNIQKSHDYKAKEIYQVMVGEYEYYIKDNFEEAIRYLKRQKILVNTKTTLLKH